jgi:hypothetical protein
MAVFTFYCHGTGSHRSRRDGEIVTTFSEHTASPFYILDGPGTPDTKSDHKLPGPLSVTHHPIPGSYNPFTRDKTLKSKTKAEYALRLKEAKDLAAKDAEEEEARKLAKVKVKGRVERILDAQGIDISTASGQRAYAERAVKNMGSGLNNPVEDEIVERDKAGKVIGVKTKYFREFKRAGLKKGTVSGYGWDDNIAEAIAVLFDRGISETTQPESNVAVGQFDVINMIGWSRGAVTCLRIANRLAEMNMPVKINIFAVDPVAGRDAGIRLEDTKEVPKIVRNYLGTLAMDEQRKGFAPQDYSRLTKKDGWSNVVLLPFPGKHNTVVRMDNGPLLNDAARVVWNLAYKFLTNFGTQFDKNLGAPMLNRNGAIDHYAKMMLRRKQYHHDLRNRGHLLDGYKNPRFAGGLGGREFTGMDKRPHETSLPALGHYVTDFNYFVNMHHRSLFGREYPRTTDWFFGNGGGAPVSVSAASVIGSELRRMTTFSPRAFELLEEMGVSRDVSTIPTTFHLPNQGVGRGGGSLNFNLNDAAGQLDGMGVME